MRSPAATRKAAWSRVAAELLWVHFGEIFADVAAELALLVEAARQPARAIEYYLLAVRKAVQVFAHLEAAEVARRLIDFRAQYLARDSKAESS
jgi:hypothetical protein